ncbi:MAG: ABC transporter ATP-binding protein [Planctomycetaceae bacterium]|nr:ABC transporter ATP-binding protein [Planctomycetaceae bacterium]
MSPHNSSTAVRVEDVTKSYVNGTRETPVLRGISCEFPAGEFAFIVGPSGSGKSTLLHLMGALDLPTSGEIYLQGRAMSQLPQSERDRLRREEIGFIFQSFNLLKNLTALDNVLIPFMPVGQAGKFRDEAKALLQRVGLGDRLDHKPSQLSGGEQQRVAIARAVLKNPSLILADEPTGELDTKSGQQIFELLRDLQQERGATIITVTHDHRYIRDEDTVMEILDGKFASQRGREPQTT